ncbi:hypothetical protein [Alkalimarinus sediminis]|uniref:Uncharacterized protein n=1 Tax=Alkalimarinus sediminis TaxID=1632866 RepID=A0A9E8KIU2_9ALTE|nr:hypothetical protein [Alkalimarinus sediminis]UZW74286.1 hypothetical protein NNL22_14845 [Alkalimarinus sediminis]
MNYALMSRVAIPLITLHSITATRAKLTVAVMQGGTTGIKELTKAD